MKKIFNILLVFTLVIVGNIGGAGILVMADDNYNYEVGVWWVTEDDEVPLEYSDDSAEGFNDRLVDAGWLSVYCYGNYDVYETDFKKVGEGNGTDIVDLVDIVFFSGHGVTGQKDPDVGCPYVITEYDDSFIEYLECEWGDNDLEWILLDCCGVLSNDSTDYWHSAMDGLHLICGAQSNVTDSDHGVHVSDLLIDDGWWDWARTIKTSWFSGMNYDLPDGRVLAVIGETSTCGDDYIWGQGTVCSDLVHDNIYTLWTYTC
jgi:hypothetical protein